MILRWSCLVHRVPALVLLTWLLAYGWLLDGNRYQAYLSPTLRPLLWAALVLLGLLFVAAVLPADGKEPVGGARAVTTRGAVLLLPLIYLVAARGQTLDSYAAAKRSVMRNMAPAGGSSVALRLAQRPPGGELTLAELVADLPRQVGHHVVTEGVVFHGPQVPPGHFVLFRFVITCCVADALPAAILVAHPRAGEFPKDTWLRVAGKLELIDASGETAGCIHPEEITVIEPPANPYLAQF